MDETKPTFPGRRTMASLTACGQCNGVFPVLDMRAHENRMYCRNCHRKIGGVDVVHGPPPPKPVPADGEGPAHDSAILRPDAEAQLFEEYAALRKRITDGEGTFELHEQAGGVASRIGLELEAVEHFRECMQERPDDLLMAQRLDNLELQLKRSGQVVDVARERQQVEERVPQEALPFWNDLGDVLGYPFRGRGTSLMIVAGLFFGGTMVIAQINLIGLLIVVCVVGYIAAYLLDVISSSAAGKTEPPDFPEPTSFLESYLFPFFSLLTCIAVAYSPCLVLGWLMVNGWLGVGFGSVLLLAGIAFGTFVLPMTLMLKSLFQDIAVIVRPGLLFGSIGRILPDYFAAFISICITWAAYVGASALLFLLLTVTLGRPTGDAMIEADASRVIAWIFQTVVTWPLLLYALLLQGHLLGRLYRQGLRRLAWFHPPTAATVRAQRLSVGIAAAGLAAALLMCGTLYGGWLVYAHVAGNPNGFTFAQKAPIEPGDELGYVWQHTDGEIGLSIYRFSDAGDGQILVTCTTETLGENAGVTTQTVGTFSSSSGIYESVNRVWLWTGTPQQAAGQHTIFYGPTSADKGDTYLNDWPCRGETRWHDTWDAWKVHDKYTTSTLHYDQSTGIYTGRRLVGIGYVVEEVLVYAKGVDVATSRKPSQFATAPWNE